VLIKEWFNNKVTGIEAHGSATKLQGSKYMIQQQNYRDQSILFAKITDQEGVAIYLRNVHVTMPYALTQIANWS